MGIDDLIFNRTDTKTDISSNPIQIFNYLDKKDGFGYLRTNQADFLKEWYERRNERDIVGIMHTGAGKTLVGLLMLQSKLVEEQEPAIYLCPTKQLVEQTVKQASYYGIDVCEIETDNRIPVEFKNAEKILVTTFSKLFNGKSIFGVKDFTNTADIIKLGSILIDDAHSCVDYARNSSTIIIKNDVSAFNEIFELFKSEIERQSYGKYNSIYQRADDSVSIQVPYWEWISKINDIKEILKTHFSRESADFEYRMIQNLLNFSRCYISGTKIEITPKYNPVEQIPSFYNAKHRYILSATINEKDLREELGIEKNAIEHPIVTNSYVVDVGERMILAPSKYHKNITDSLIRTWMITECKKQNLGLVVIVPSRNSVATKEWEELGAKIIDNSNYEAIFSGIESGIKEQVVLVNRYEGIDFPGEQSHILILDGLPEFSTNKDKAISITSQDDNWKLKIVQKIEQGLGRTVRSNSDYSVVLLLGDRLIDFISLKSNMKYFSLATQSQLSISNELVAGLVISDVKAAQEEIVKSINYCLSRNSSWVKYAKDKLSEVNVSELAHTDISDIENEYDSYKQYIRQDYGNSISKLEALKTGKSGNELGRIYQEEAEVRFHRGDIQNSQNLQKLAYEEWDYAFRPEIAGYQKTLKVPDVIEASFKFITDHSDKYSLSKFIDDIIGKLRYDNEASSEHFEQAIEDLGRLLGLHSTRPEKIRDDGGPDNLWLSKDFQFVIECKNREMNKIDKDDVEQLLHSELWFTNNYGKGFKQKLVLFHSDLEKETNVHFSDNMFIVPKDKLFRLKDGIEQLKQLLNNNFDNLTINKLQEYFVKTNLSIHQIEQNFFKKAK
ncbi:TPA: DEAD/DEAH box helicase family protein [Streptococcus suis]|uniref:DEAD/DEAH box helicase n=3 Tax=Streptococcus suis TaxID=1307 RepID=UPI000CF58720|nr:DEAD/DEAH box helicase [Streptococcus suis]NQK13318.1 DEAD/DEAH box helicase family protein [Streptococcus suis]HEM4695572.1 DEAD/DEAH box helicase family protein [Streptococcus suis]HEM4703352.1 DEAD/DEAH box helicase family protein [Streptococcus suis]HEM4859584.1 DEAD/DEAH box helicase family protein [Streptococcus suis]HEM4897368.1 DEAD/DEAH box helicase family protein [Streptococcus suis]